MSLNSMSLHVSDSESFFKTRIRASVQTDSPSFPTLIYVVHTLAKQKSTHLELLIVPSGLIEAII